jgi:integrase
MPRPRKDGTPAAPPRHKRLTELFVARGAKPRAAVYNVWDEKQGGLVLRVQPTGAQSWKAVYRHHGRARWLHIGDVRAIGLADARKMAARVMLQAADGRDPVAERRAERSQGTFQELADRYLEQHARRRNKSWHQARFLVERYVLPRWGKLQAKAITRADVRALMSRINAPILANQVLASASAIFSWAIKQDVVMVNPCKGVDRNEVHSRERVLADSEVPMFWRAFDDAGLVAGSALKVILLTGQRPGEIACMRREHIIDGWWTMPGKPMPELGWPGTKNGASHRVWLSQPVQDILAELGDGAITGFVFAGPRGGSLDGLDAAMRGACQQLGVNEKVTPHDLRRSFSSKVTGLGFGRDAMNRLTNHKDGGISSVYDRHGYGPENQRIMEAVGAHILALAEGRGEIGGNVVQIR